MTLPEKISKRKAFNKAIRARAAQEQTSFASVLHRTQNAQQTRTYRSMLNMPTHLTRPARRDGMRAEDKLRDSGHDTQYEQEHPYLSNGKVESEARQIVIDLMTIAKPAKVKGVAKDFEVIKPIRSVIALDDGEMNLVGDDDWEEIMPVEAQKRRTYSSALRGR